MSTRFGSTGAPSRRGRSSASCARPDAPSNEPRIGMSEHRDRPPFGRSRRKISKPPKERPYLRFLGWVTLVWFIFVVVSALGAASADPRDLFADGSRELAG